MRAWKCPDCRGILVCEDNPPVHLPGSVVYQVSGECPDCGLALDDDWSDAETVDPEAAEAAIKAAKRQILADALTNATRSLGRVEHHD